MAVRPGCLATPNLRNDHNSKEDGENHGRSHAQGQKECKLDPKTEWCDIHYQEHMKKIQTNRWADHVARRSDNRWTIRVTEWIHMATKRFQGRSRTRWCDDFLR